MCNACSYLLWGPQGRCCPPGVCTSASAAHSSHKLLQQTTKIWLLAKVTLTSWHPVINRCYQVWQSSWRKHQIKDGRRLEMRKVCSELFKAFIFSTEHSGNLTVHLPNSSGAAQYHKFHLMYEVDDVMAQSAAKHLSIPPSSDSCRAQSELTLDSRSGCDRSSPIDWHELVLPAAASESIRSDESSASWLCGVGWIS